jgi:hypothetical protein
MRVSITLLPLLLLLGAGCKGTTANNNGSQFTDSVQITAFSSGDGTFLVSDTEGKVWKFSLKDHAFIKIPVTSKLLSYNPTTHNLDSAPDPEKVHNGPFHLFSSNDGTFLIERNVGRTWQYDPKSTSFQEIPVTTEIVAWDRDSKGALQETPEKNSSGKPCDRKSDPLCIR